jgi:hypothetical protein
MSEPVWPATDEEVAQLRECCKNFPDNGLADKFGGLLARLDAAEQKIRELVQAGKGVLDKSDKDFLRARAVEADRDTALARVAELERLLRPVAEFAQQNDAYERCGEDSTPLRLHFEDVSGKVPLTIGDCRAAVRALKV